MCWGLAASPLPRCSQCGVVMILYYSFPARQSRPRRRRESGAAATLRRRRRRGGATPAATRPRSPPVWRTAVGSTSGLSGRAGGWRRSPLSSPDSPGVSLRAANTSFWGRRLPVFLPVPRPMSRWGLCWAQRYDYMVMLQTMFMYQTVSRKSVRYHTLQLSNRWVQTGAAK